MPRTIRKRSYITKSGELRVYKPYEYDISYRYKKTDKRLPAKESLITKSGKIKKTKLAKIYKEHSSRIKSDFEKLNFEADLKVQIDTLKKAGKPLYINTEQAFGTFINKSLTTMLINTGFTLDQLAEKANTTVNRLLDDLAWNDDWTLFTNEHNETYKFTFSYDGQSVFEKVNLTEVGI